MAGYAALQITDVNATTARIVLSEGPADMSYPPSPGIRCSPRLAECSRRIVDRSCRRTVKIVLTEVCLDDGLGKPSDFRCLTESGAELLGKQRRRLEVLEILAAHRASPNEPRS